MPAIKTRNTACRPPLERGVAIQQSGGFTLVELIVTLSIAAILLSIAAPSFQQVIRTNRIAATTNELSASLQLARSEAVTRGTRVTVCKSANIDAAAPICSTSANWQDGWLVFVDGGTAGIVDGGDSRLRVSQPGSNAIRISGDTNFANFISYRPDGRSAGQSVSGSPTGTITLCLPPNQRQITTNNTGRVIIREGACS